MPNKELVEKFQSLYRCEDHFDQISDGNICKHLATACATIAEEYAREMSVGFKIWSEGRKFDINPATDLPYSTPQLYTLYIEHLKQLNG